MERCSSGRSEERVGCEGIDAVNKKNGNDAIFSMSHISKSFGAHLVLRDINLEIIRGQVTVIIGPSGGGKSTLLRCFSLLEMPNEGVINFDGCDLFRSDGKSPHIAKSRVLRTARSEMPTVFQNFDLFNNKNVIENVMLGPLIVQRRNKREVNQEASHILSRVGLNDKHGVFPHELSGGEKQRVAIARALVMRPKMLLFDEPTSALDPELVSGVLDMIKLLARDGMTLIIVTHEMGFARELADEILFVSDGAILKKGSSSEIFDNPQESRIVDFVSSFRRAS
jgi:ABC-type polar amino acid transport system ATPase subunit